jgi:hypothetical protein
MGAADFSPDIYNDVKRLMPPYLGYRHSKYTPKIVTKCSLETLITTYKSIRCHNLGNYRIIKKSLCT